MEIVIAFLFCHFFILSYNRGTRKMGENLIPSLSAASLSARRAVCMICLP